MTNFAAFDLSITQRRILDIVRRQSQITRADLALMTGLTPGAISRLIRDLLDIGLIKELGRITGMRGQPAVPLGIDGNGGISIGISFPYGRLDVVALDYAGSQIAEIKTPYEGHDPTELHQILLQQITEIMGQNKRLTGIGLAIPGHLKREEKTDFVIPPTLDWLNVEDLTNWLYTSFKCPVFVENIANAAAIAETYGAEGKIPSDLAAINFGHGIGLGLMLSGRIHRGAGGVAGEIGSLYPINQPRPSALDLLTVLRSTGRNVPTIDDLAAISVIGDAVVEAWIERAAQQLFPMVQMLHMMTAPKQIVLTGMLPTSVTTPLAERLSQQVGFNAPNAQLFPTRITAGKFGTISNAIGGAWLPIESEGWEGLDHIKWGNLPNS